MHSFLSRILFLLFRFVVSWSKMNEKEKKEFVLLREKINKDKKQT